MIRVFEEDSSLLYKLSLNIYIKMIIKFNFLFFKDFKLDCVFFFYGIRK